MSDTGINPNIAYSSRKSNNSERQIQIPAFMFERQNQKQRNSAQKSDEFIKQKQDISCRNKQNAYKSGFMTGFVTAMAILSAGIGIKYQTTKEPNIAIVEYSSNGDLSLDEIADNYDSTLGIIEAYNGDDIENLTEIGVPKKLELLEDKIDTLKQSLYKDNLDNDSIIEINNEIQQLTKVQEYQNAVADVYQDGNMLYFVIKDADEVSDSELYDYFYSDYYSSTINVEDFKNLFSIKEGALKANNDLNYFWDDNPEAELGGSSARKNFTRNNFHAGDVIKVKKSDINYKKILDSFSEFENSIL